MKTIEDLLDVYYKELKSYIGKDDLTIDVLKDCFDSLKADLYHYMDRQMEAISEEMEDFHKNMLTF